MAAVLVEERFDIDEFLATEQSKDLLRLTTAGSVDDGKSTLIGRLLHDAHGAYEDQLQSVRRGGQVDFALLTDGLRAEREQGITIDVAYRYFATLRRKFILADTPGHLQYTRNMATGASTADLAIVLVDALRGVTAQSYRHAYIAALLGIRHFVIAVNKMDLVGFSEEVFDGIRAGFAPHLNRLGVRDSYFLPMSALLGDNVVERSRKMSWFEGESLLEHLENIKTQVGDLRYDAFRMAVQSVIRPDRTFRGYAGQIASGIVRPGDEVLALPSGLRTRVERIVTYDGDLDEAFPPMSVTLTLEDDIDIGRGDMLTAAQSACSTSKTIEATVVWFDARPLDPARDYLIRHTTQTIPVRVDAVLHRVNVATLENEPSAGLSMNDIGGVRITTARPIFFDAYAQSRTGGSFILIDRETNATAGAGMIQ